MILEGVRYVAKKKKKRPARNGKVFCDYHHILFQGRHWKCGWAKTLREHPYCGAFIPQTTLHRIIHSKIHDVPTPNGSDCRHAVKRLDYLLENGLISLEDRLDKKIEIVAECFRTKCPATTAILDWQREVVSKFYSKGG